MQNYYIITVVSSSVYQMQYRQLLYTLFTDDNGCTQSVIPLLRSVESKRNRRNSWQQERQERISVQCMPAQQATFCCWECSLEAPRVSLSLKLLLYWHGVQKVFIGKRSFKHNVSAIKGKVKSSQKLRPSQPPLLDEGTRRRSHWKTWNGKSASTLNDRSPYMCSRLGHLHSHASFGLHVCYHGYLTKSGDFCASGLLQV